tara:strand:- start:177476 stop:177784 length:309 start_codon:yes stop_codon:yes gene_type:complete
MKKVTKEKWVAALESGTFKQGNGQLRHRNKYCCLGVLCEITGNSKNRNMSDTFPKMNDSGTDNESFMGLSTRQQDKLAILNDTGTSFKDIAKHVKQYVRVDD